MIAIVAGTHSDLLSDKLVVVSSDFKRAKETAEILHQHFKVREPLCIDKRLRERNFGELNMTSSTNYQKVWTNDAQHPDHTMFGCESVTSVLSRTISLIKNLEEEHENDGKIILLVSHGDTLQITITAYAGVAPECHRSLGHLGNCDVRELVKPANQVNQHKIL